MARQAEFRCRTFAESISQASVLRCAVNRFAPRDLLARRTLGAGLTRQMAFVFVGFAEKTVPGSCPIWQSLDWWDS
jgi:hypothetical protein